MSTVFLIVDHRRMRIFSTFKAVDALAAKRRVKALLSSPSSPVAREPRRYTLSMLVDLPAGLTAGLPFTASASAVIVDAADLIGRDPAAVGYDVGGYMSCHDPAFTGAPSNGTVH